MRHFIICIKRKTANRRDVEIIFTKALINFKCSQADYNIVYILTISYK